MNGTVGSNRHNDVASLMSVAAGLATIGAVAVAASAFAAHTPGVRLGLGVLCLVLIGGALAARQAASIIVSSRRALADALAMARSGATIDVRGITPLVGSTAAE